MLKTTFTKSELLNRYGFNDANVNPRYEVRFQGLSILNKISSNGQICIPRLVHCSFNMKDVPSNLPTQS